MQNDAIEDAAALALIGAYTASERERAQAVALEILRCAGKVASNASAIGESKRQRASKKETEELIRNSYAAQHLAGLSAKNPTQKKEDK